MRPSQWLPQCANIGQFVVVELWNQFWDLDEKHRVAHEIAYVAVEEYDYLTLKYVIAQDHDGDKDVTAMEGWNVREFSACGNNLSPPLPPPNCPGKGAGRGARQPYTLPAQLCTLPPRNYYLLLSLFLAYCL